MVALASHTSEVGTVSWLSWWWMYLWCCICILLCGTGLPWAQDVFLAQCTRPSKVSAALTLYIHVPDLDRPILESEMIPEHL